MNPGFILHRYARKSCSASDRSGVADSCCCLLPYKHLDYLLPILPKRILHCNSQPEASDVAQTLAFGWVPQFRGRRRGFRANHSQVRRPWCAVCVYRRRLASIPDHESIEGWCCRRGFASTGLSRVRRDLRSRWGF